MITWDGEYCYPTGMMPLNYLSYNLLRVCASQKHFVGLPEQKVRSDELFLKCLMGSWKIQKYVSVVLTSSRGAMAVIHPQTLIPLVEEMLGSNKT